MVSANVLKTYICETSSSDKRIVDKLPGWWLFDKAKGSVAYLEIVEELTKVWFAINRDISASIEVFPK